jgi:hypothetical protein
MLLGCYGFAPFRTANVFVESFIFEGAAGVMFEEMIIAGLAWIAAHELGHTYGLRHDHGGGSIMSDELHASQWPGAVFLPSDLAHLTKKLARAR